MGAQVNLNFTFLLLLLGPVCSQYFYLEIAEEAPIATILEALKGVLRADDGNLDASRRVLLHRVRHIWGWKRKS